MNRCSGAFSFGETEGLKRLTIFNNIKRCRNIPSTAMFQAAFQILPRPKAILNAGASCIYLKRYRNNPAFLHGKTSDKLHTLSDCEKKDLGSLARSRTGNRRSGRQIGKHTSELQSRGHLVCRLLL